MKQTEEHINLNGLDIYVKMIGSGEPVVFLHGGPGDEHNDSRRNWKNECYRSIGRSCAPLNKNGRAGK